MRDAPITTLEKLERLWGEIAADAEAARAHHGTYDAHADEARVLRGNLRRIDELLVALAEEHCL